ncbi:MAG: SDR family oxidoreductase [Polyangiales bacterium]
MSIASEFQGKRILLTGVTGFLGKVWLSMMLQHVDEMGEVLVLIRPQKGSSARKRFDAIVERSPAFRPLRDKHGADVIDFVEKRVRIVEGEITQPFLGKSRTVVESEIKDVDLVMHFAGLTDFEPDPTLALSANIDGAMHAAELAAMSRGKRYVHCSTSFVAGTSDGDVSETLQLGVAPNGTSFDIHNEVRTLRMGLQHIESKSDRVAYAMGRAAALGWPNIYTYTKGLAEHLVAKRNDIHSTTVRPAIVECARNYPFPGWNEGINTAGPIVWLLSTTFRRFPSRPKNHFDVIPVDTTARACTLVAAAALRNEAKEVYHVGSSDLNPFYFGRAVELTGLAERKRHRESGTDFEKHIVSRLDSITVDADKPQLLSVSQLHRGAQELRRWLREFNPEDNLSPKLYRRWGKRIESNRRRAVKELRNGERKLGAIRDMLLQYRPFIHDHDYVFKAGNILHENEKLDPSDRELWRFDIDTLDWRDYWLNVEVPGLETWCIPKLRGERVPEDPPFIHHSTRSTENELDSETSTGDRSAAQ